MDSLAVDAAIAGAASCVWDVVVDVVVLTITRLLRNVMRLQQQSKKINLLVRLQCPFQLDVRNFEHLRNLSCLQSYQRHVQRLRAV